MNGNILTQCSAQWATRPDDERFTSLTDMLAHMQAIRAQSRAIVCPSNRMAALPAAAVTDDPTHRGLLMQVEGDVYAPTHWAFGQLAQLAGAPAGYLRALPAPIAADCVNWGLQKIREVQDTGVLLYRNGAPILRAATGPNYGRIWNSDIVAALIERFGDGQGDTFRIPGEFGKRVPVTKDNTTLYASDRDMFVFLADEDHRIEVPNRRDGETGTLARGFFVWNTETGGKTFGLATFLFDYACRNRIVWGAQEYREIKIRHTSGAPDRFLREVAPALLEYSRSSTASITQALTAARAAKIGDEDQVTEFLGKRFGARMVPALQAIHKLEEGRPIATLWDATTAVTAYARANVQHQDARVELERQAGDLLTLATA